ncbi:kelch repeat-containing protein [soil metagenome]
MRYQIFTAAVLMTLLGFTANCSAQRKPGDAVNHLQTYGKISEIDKLSEARASHTATLLKDGKVLIAGGMQRNGVFFDDAEIFDPKTDRFTQSKNKMTKKRVSHTATRLRDGRVLIAGGWSNQDLPEMSAEMFDPQTGKFTTVWNLNPRRSAHTETLLDDGKVLITGGFDGEKNLDDVEVFDPKTNTFTLTGKMRNARLAHTATKLADGKIFLAGGETARGQILSSAEIFDPKNNSFSLVKNAMTAVRYKHDAILLNGGSVLIFGGSDSREWRGQHKTAEIFDPKTGRFSPTREMNFARFKIDGTTVILKDGKVFIGGGSESAEVFDPQTKSFTRTNGEFGLPIHYASVTLLPDGRALIVGGYGNGTREAGPISTNRAWIFKL